MHDSRDEGEKPIQRIDSALGIARWCIPGLFQSALKTFRKAKEEMKTLKVVPPSSSIELNSVQRKLFESTRCILLINVDNYTAWNTRYDCIT